MKFSVVTISFNQAEFLERTIRSVLDQSHSDVEYIVVDPGSSDESRAIIEKYRDRLARVIYEPDNGPADGLNKGFSYATGDVYAYLNSDDVLYPGSLAEADRFLSDRPEIDVVSGHCRIIDADDRPLRLSHSDRFSLSRYAHGVGVLMQPSTFFRASAFRATNGFNVMNRSNWDGELFVDMAYAGARFARHHRIWSGYRLHATSITGSAAQHPAFLEYRSRIFARIMGRKRRWLDGFPFAAHRVLKYLETPQALSERLLRGPVYGRIRPSAHAASGR